MLLIPKLELGVLNANKWLEVSLKRVNYFYGDDERKQPSLDFSQ